MGCGPSLQELQWKAKWQAQRPDLELLQEAHRIVAECRVDSTRESDFTRKYVGDTSGAIRARIDLMHEKRIAGIVDVETYQASGYTSNVAWIGYYSGSWPETHPERVAALTFQNGILRSIYHPSR